MSCRIAVIFFLVICRLSIWAQMPEYGGHVHYGFIAPHNPQMVHLITGHSWGGNLYCEWKTSMHQPWHHDFGRPSHLLDYTLIHTGNLEQLGIQHALSYQLKLPIGQNTSRQHLLIGIGPGYSTKKWDLQSNRQAFALGSHFNAALIIGCQYRLAKFKGQELDIGLRLTHFSNGAFAMPNAGTNNIGLQLGWKITRLQSEPCAPVQDSIPQWQWDGIVCGGIKEIQPPQSKKFPVYSLQQTLMYQVNRKSGFMLQLDGMFNTSNAVIKAKENRLSETPSSKLQVGIAAGYQIRFGQVGLFIQQGYYVLDPYGYDGRLYHRFGLRIAHRGKWFIHFALKTHFAKADHGELGLGWSFWRTGAIIRGGKL
jgi:Lipid A 3-O-deacylase (PagL)